MDVRKLLIPVLLLCIATGAYAADGCVTASSNLTDYPPITLAFEHTGACVKFTMTHAQNATDFNNYIVSIDSTEGGRGDFNTTSKVHSLCTVEGGEVVTFYAQAYDGNKTDYRCGADYNVQMTVSETGDAARSFVYTGFVVLGSIIGAVVFIIVAVFVIRRTGIKLPYMKR